MAIVITRRDDADAHVLKVDGFLSAEDADELLRAWHEMSGRRVLDLTDLRYADRRGVGVLRELRGRGARFVGLSPYLGLLLEQADRPPGG